MGRPFLDACAQAWKKLVMTEALGKTKAEYFDRGLLKRGMIRSSLAAVEQRLERQGKI